MIMQFTDGACASTCALLVEMFTEVGVKTIVAGGLPKTGPMQAVGGNRGAATFSADGLDSDLKTLISIEGNVTDPTDVPLLDNEGHRDSGVYTTVLGVNLRDQVRLNDTVPLQFKYEAADCRIFYTLDNIYNMSRLWRDVVSASFDDASLCVADSTGFRGSSKPAPIPSSTKLVALDLNFTNPDELLAGPGLDRSGGLGDISLVRRRGRVDLCNPQGCGDPGSQCIDVLLNSCRNRASQAYFPRCVPVVGGQDFCPDNTLWDPTERHIPRPVNSQSKSGAFQEKRVQYTGPCKPNADSFCV